MARQINEVGELVLAVGWLVEDELRQVLHVTRPTRIVGVGENRRGELPAGTAAEPVGTFGDQAPIPGRVRQDQVRHDAQALAGRGVDEPANQLGRRRLGPATDTGMQLARIGHRVDAAGRSGGEEGVDVDPVESHRPHPREMIRPSRRSVRPEVGGCCRCAEPFGSSPFAPPSAHADTPTPPSRRTIEHCRPRTNAEMRAPLLKPSGGRVAGSTAADDIPVALVCGEARRGLVLRARDQLAARREQIRAASRDPGNSSTQSRSPHRSRLGQRRVSDPKC